MKDDYADILHLPHHVSDHRPRMGMVERAAQFSPFAALTGYDSAVKETARLTEGQRELTEDRMAQLDGRLHRLEQETCPQVTVTYFQPDTRKSGGAYCTVTGNLLRVEHHERLLLLEAGTSIPLNSITALESPLFSKEDL